MTEMPSTQFRKSFARLAEATIVTVHGHSIGTWTPLGAAPVSPTTPRDRGRAGGASFGRPRPAPKPGATRA